MAATEQDLLDAAADVARHFRSFDAYGRNRKTAIRALHRRVPSRSREDCAVAFDRALQLFDRCKELMNAESRRYLDLDAKKKKYDFSDLVVQVKPDFAEFDDRTIEGLLGWTFMYYHLM